MEVKVIGNFLYILFYSKRLSIADTTGLYTSNIGMTIFNTLLYISIVYIQTVLVRSVFFVVYERMVLFTKPPFLSVVKRA
jgi:uncharacterized membrane protein